MPILEPFEALSLSVHQSPGVYALLVGSGLSRAAGIPSGWEITLKLVERLGAVRAAGDQVDWAKWYRDTFSEEPSYSRILDALASTPAERRNILHGFIVPQPGDDARRPTKAHHAIARLVVDGHVRVIVTPNFDRLLETALREAGIEPTIIASADAATGATPLVHSQCTLIKVHGDYLDARIRNTQAELAAYEPATDALLDEVFDRFGLIAVGWSGEWDEALRAAIVRAPSRRYPFYWVARGSVGALAQDLIDLRGGLVVSAAGADEFFGRLTDVLDALKHAARPHPLSVAMAVALAKKYCRDDRYALEWAELLEHEAAPIREFVQDPSFPVNDGSRAAKLIEILAERSEGIRRLCMVCGRWGTERNKKAVTHLIGTLLPRSSLSGLTALIELRDAAAALCFYWFLGGAYTAGDFTTVQQAMYQRVVRFGEEHWFLTVLPLKHSDGLWSQTKQLAAQGPPSSEFLYSLFRKESADIALAPTDTADVFDTLELLIALENAHLSLAKMKEDANAWLEIPAGRYVHSDAARQKLRDIERMYGVAQLIRAGLLGGTTETAQAAGAEVSKFVQKWGRRQRI